MAADLVLVRHPPVAVKGLCYGQSDVPLAMTIEAACDAIIDDPLVLSCRAVISSPWARAMDLANAVGHRIQIPVYSDQRLSEIHYGSWEQLRFDTIEQHFPRLYKEWMENWQIFRPPGGETLTEFRARIEGWLDAVPRHSDPILIVTHGGVIKTLRSLARGTDLATAYAEPVAYLKPELLRL